MATEYVEFSSRFYGAMVVVFTIYMQTVNERITLGNRVQQVAYQVYAVPLVYYCKYRGRKGIIQKYVAIPNYSITNFIIRTE